MEPVVQREQGFVVLLKPEARYGFIKCVPGSMPRLHHRQLRLACLLGQWQACDVQALFGY